MEIDVTAIIEGHELTDYSDSIANSGLQNIGQITWRNAVNACAAMDDPLVTSEQQSELREWIADFGAWSRQEIEEMSDNDTCALLLQFIASEGQRYLEAEEEDRLDDYMESEGGNLYRGDDERFYFLVSS